MFGYGNGNWFKALGGAFDALVSAFKTRVLGDGGTYESGCLAAILGEIGQPILDQASLLTTPNAYKASTIYSITPTDASGDLDFSRASTATRVNASGLIEEVASNVPRMDYSNGCPQILLEPQRTNLITYSEDLSDASWNKTRTTITSNAATSPDGTTNADLAECNVSGLSKSSKSSLSYTSGVSYTFSFFAKYISQPRISLSLSGAIFSSSTNIFDIQNGTTISGSAQTIEDYGNGWYRCSVVRTANTTDVSTAISIQFADETTGAGVSGNQVYIWGAMVEQGSYATSYIKTEGAAATRLLETSSTSGLSSLIDSTEGVLYVEMAALADDGTTRLISIVDATGTNRINMGFNSTSGVIYFSSSGTSPNISIFPTGVTQTDLNKIAFKYKANDCAVWVNGVEIGTSVSFAAYAANVFSKIEFKNGAGAFNYFYGKVSALSILPYLTDQELQDLTT